MFAAAWERRRSGGDPIPPEPELVHAADYLRMLGQDPAGPRAAAHARALDAYLVTVADHGMNASTFTARVVASTGSDPVSAVVAAIGALKGPLHGGAPGPVLDMLDAMASETEIVPWIETALSRRERLMGFGHRIYRTRDPRADVLKAVVAELGPARGSRVR